jgi:hypothetical protein
MRIRFLAALVMILSYNSGFSQALCRIDIRFVGYDSSRDKGFVDVVIPDLLDPYRQQLAISEGGEFSSTLNILETREIQIEYDEKDFSFIVMPGDDVRLSIDLPDFLLTGKLLNVKISGKLASTNNLILTHSKQIKEWIQLSGNAFAADKSIGPLNYKTKRINEMSDQLELLNRLIAGNKIKDPVFISWAKSKIRHAAAIDLSLFPFMGRMSRDLSDRSEYFSYISLIDPNEKQTVWVESYFKYLETLVTTFQIVANTSDAYKEQRKTIEKQPSGHFDIIYSVFNRLPEGHGKELMIARLFQTIKKVPSPYWDSLAGKVDPTLIQLVKRDELSESKPIMELINSYGISEKEKKELLKIYSGASGKIIYHDFLVLGCPPCLRELSEYKVLMDKAGNDVEFIFFGYKMSNAELSDLIGKYHLTGYQFVLSKNQFAFFERYFKVRSFPHHQIIDKKGIIVAGQAPGPSSMNLDYILKKFDSLR